MRVLVVDDDCTLTSSIREVLENEGIEVMTAKDGIDGYSAYLAFMPDVVVTEVQMPRRSGVEMMQRIRNHHPGIQTVYMSGHMGAVRPFLREEAKRFLVTFFEKPFPLNSLKQVVDRSRGNPRANAPELKRQPCGKSVPEKKDRHLSWRPCWALQE
jgi:DNA-binding NtrC family response regulator